MTFAQRLPLVAIAVALLVPAGASAATTSSVSTNWSGYAVHKNGKRFKRVAATWVQPRVSCSSRSTKYSAFWVGLGGYHSDSSALEQIGTSGDCVRGTARYTAWYELVPADSVNLSLKVRAGDRISASVVVAGKQVRLRLANRTTGAIVAKVLRAKTVDTRSAEWIVEAPSLCDSTSCETQALADFGTASFTNASATTTGGHVGTISDPVWAATALTLSGAAAPPGPRFLASASTGEAAPSVLSAGGDAFAVDYADAQ